MRAIITGGGGFIGGRLARLLLSEEKRLEGLALVDAKFAKPPPDDARVRIVAGDLRDKAVRADALQGGADVIFHLVTIPGGAAESDYRLARQVNLDSTLDFIEEAADTGKRPRVVFTSSVAVFGAPLPAAVDDATPPRPAMVYGAQKLMMEIALDDFSRRGLIDSVAVRLPGIVPRPRAPSGMKSAFMSDIFHALAAGERFTAPVSPQATMWLMSVSRVAANLKHAASVKAELLPPGRALTLPAVLTSMAQLAAAIAAETGVDPKSVSYAPDEALEPQFGRQPPLSTPAAERAGFRNDGDVQSLVRQAFQDLKDS